MPMKMNSAGWALALDVFQACLSRVGAKVNGPVTLLCRSKCSFRSPSAQRLQGFSSRVLSGVAADCRSR